MPEYKQISGFFGGLNLFGRGDTVKDTEITGGRNLTIKHDSLQLDTGYILETTEISGTPNVKLVYNLLDEDGTKESFLFTKTKVFIWSTNEWVEVLDESDLALDNAGHSPDPITGSDIYQICAVTFPGSVNTAGHSQVIWTNGIDVVHKIYNDSGTWKCRSIEGLTDIDVDSCKCLAVWQDSVWIFNIDVDGTVVPYESMWCVPTNEEQWDTSSYSSAGYYDLLGKSDPIVQAEVLGAYLIAYRTNSIWRGTWVGSYAQPVVFEEVIANEGVVGGFPVANMNDWHCVVGKSNIYKYAGGLNLEPIGDYVHKRIYDDDGILDLDYIDYIKAAHVQESDTIWLMFPVMDTANGASYTHILRYHIKYKAWTERRINLFLTSIGLLHLTEDDTWGGATGRDGTWMEARYDGSTLEEAVGPPRAWLSQVFKYDFPYVFFSAIDSDYKGYLIRYDYQQTTDGATGEYDASGDIRITAVGDNIPWEFKTKNFSGGSSNIRAEHFQIHIAGSTGTSINCYYSINDGVSWNSLESIVLTRDENNTEEFQRYKVWMNVSCENIMFKFSGQGGSVRFGASALGYYPEPI